MYYTRAKPSEQATKTRSAKFTAVCFPVSYSYALVRHLIPHQTHRGLILNSNKWVVTKTQDDGASPGHVKSTGKFHLTGSGK